MHISQQQRVLLLGACKLLSLIVEGVVNDLIVEAVLVSSVDEGRKDVLKNFTLLEDHPKACAVEIWLEVGQSLKFN